MNLGLKKEYYLIKKRKKIRNSGSTGRLSALKKGIIRLGFEKTNKQIIQLGHEKKKRLTNLEPKKKY